MNGCAYCIDMHLRLRALGEPNRRDSSSTDAGVSPHVNDRERAALEWARPITFVMDVTSDEVFEQATEQVNGMKWSPPRGRRALSNGWNR